MARLVVVDEGISMHSVPTWSLTPAIDDQVSMQSHVESKRHAVR